MEVEYSLGDYQGPLELLLRLIARHEINIHDIPIAQLTDQYLQALAGLPPDMDNMSEFLVMAATLLEIKSRMLLARELPQPEVEEEDPRAALVEKLLALQQAQALAAQLQTLTPPGVRLPGPGEPALATLLAQPPSSPLLDVSLAHIWAAFEDVMLRRTARIDPIRAGFGEVVRERFTVTEKVAYLQQRARSSPQPLRLFDLFDDCHSRHEMIVTFLALLEMVRRGWLCVQQPGDFDDIYCEVPHENNPLPPM